MNKIFNIYFLLPHVKCELRCLECFRFYVLKSMFFPKTDFVPLSILSSLGCVEFDSCHILSMLNI